MRAIADLKRRNLVVAIAGLGVISIAFVSIAARGQEARSKPANSRESKVDALVLCVRASQGLDGIRSCVAEDTWPRFFAEPETDRPGAVSAQGVWTPKLSVASGIREALVNVAFCSDRYFGPDRETVDPEIHGVCVWGATELFLVRAGWGEDSSPSPSRADGYDFRRAIDLILTVADVTRLAALDARTSQTNGDDERVQRGQAPVVGNENGGQLAVAAPEGAGTPTFKQCLDTLDENLAECKRRYGGVGGDTGLLAICNDGAKAAFTECAKKSMPAA